MGAARVLLSRALRPQRCAGGCSSTSSPCANFLRPHNAPRHRSTRRHASASSQQQHQHQQQPQNWTSLYFGTAAAVVFTSTLYSQLKATTQLGLVDAKTAPSLAALPDEDDVLGKEDDSAPDAHPDMLTYDDVQKHVSPNDCWVIINGNVYDVTDFLKVHPGGVKAILAEAGKDATELFTTLHPPDALKNLPPSACRGPIDVTTIPPPEEKELTEAEHLRLEALEEMPPAQNMLLLQDFEDWASRVLTGTAWSYYRSAADEERTFDENRAAFRRYFFRPRVLRDMSHGTTETTVLGIPTSMPIFIAPAAMAKLGHPLGEVNLVRASGTCGVIQGISANASCSVEELFDARQGDQPLFYQLYLNKDRSASEKVIQKVDKLGAKAIIFTVDVLWQSKRTMDVRAKAESSKPLPTAPSSASADAAASSNKKKSVSEAIGGYQDHNLTWSDIGFIRKFTKLPIIVKGVQCVEDVQLCVDNGVEGVILSNHGGRQVDYAPAPIDVLYEIRTFRPDLFDKIEVMIDGGVRSGADVVKALALGAKAVGIGRPVLYANGTHGEDGVQRVFEILQEEINNTMRNIGVNKISDLKPEMVGPAGPWVGLNRPAYVPPPPPAPKV